MSDDTGTTPNDYRCGYVALVGPPNVGKSTLLNRLVGAKVSIATRRPQTTRHRIAGIKTTADTQMIYIDTPGIQNQYDNKLHQAMNRSALAALHDVDATVLMVDGVRWGDTEAYVAERIRSAAGPLIVAINKVDTIKRKEVLLPHIEFLQELLEPRSIVPISARTGRNVDRLEALVAAAMPLGPPLFTADQITDRSMRFMAAEIIREKLMTRFGQEVPYRVAVEIERFEEREKLARVFAVIWVERSGQKAIVVGKNGEHLKHVGIKARAELETWLDKKVFLKLWVKVKSGWSDDDRTLKSLGIQD